MGTCSIGAGERSAERTGCREEMICSVDDGVAGTEANKSILGLKLVCKYLQILAHLQGIVHLSIIFWPHSQLASLAPGLVLSMR